jgi:hypothetical protein
MYFAKETFYEEGCSRGALRDALELRESQKLTQNAERLFSRRFAFYAVLRMTCVETEALTNFSRAIASRPVSATATPKSPKTLFVSG